MRIFGREANNPGVTIEAVKREDSSRRPLAVIDAAAFGLVADWQQRGLESFSGHGFCKLRLTLAPTPSAATAISI
jgi:hypothetical protein